MLRPKGDVEGDAWEEGPPEDGEWAWTPLVKDKEGEEAYAKSRCESAKIGLGVGWACCSSWPKNTDCSLFLLFPPVVNNLDAKVEYVPRECANGARELEEMVYICLNVVGE